MEKVTTNDIVVDQFGNVDVAFYEAKAAKMRAEAIAEGFAIIKSALANFFRHAEVLPKTRNA